MSCPKVTVSYQYGPVLVVYPDLPLVSEGRYSNEGGLVVFSTSANSWIYLDPANNSWTGGTDPDDPAGTYTPSSTNGVDYQTDATVTTSDSCSSDSDSGSGSAKSGSSVSESDSSSGSDSDSDSDSGSGSVSGSVSESDSGSGSASGSDSGSDSSPCVHVSHDIGSGLLNYSSSTLTKESDSETYSDSTYGDQTLFFDSTNVPPIWIYESPDGDIWFGGQDSSDPSGTYTPAGTNAELFQYDVTVTYSDPCSH